MCTALEELKREGIQEGERKAKKEIALALAAMGLSAEKIARAQGSASIRSKAGWERVSQRLAEIPERMQETYQTASPYRL